MKCAQRLCKHGCSRKRGQEYPIRPRSYRFLSLQGTGCAASTGRCHTSRASICGQGRENQRIFCKEQVRLGRRQDSCCHAIYSKVLPACSIRFADLGRKCEGTLDGIRRHLSNGGSATKEGPEPQSGRGPLGSPPYPSSRICGFQCPPGSASLTMHYRDARRRPTRK
jgi:hypothetical protein